MKKPRILLFDIETQPNIAYVWGKWEQNVIAYKEEWQLLSVAYKWLGDKKIHCATKQNRQNDKYLAKLVHNLFEKADIVIAHNGDQFDIKKVKARMAFYKLTPPKQLVSVDTRKVAKREFAFNGNGLDELGQHLQLGKKYKHSGFDMWLGCMRNDPKAWKEMIFYNKKDVELLEKVYKHFLPWISNHPNLTRLINPSLLSTTNCPSCASNNIRKNGFRSTTQGIQQRMVCFDCSKHYLTRFLR